MKKVLKWIGILLGCVLILAAGLIIYLTATDYKPDPVSDAPLCSYSKSAENVDISQPFTVLTWNTGYGGAELGLSYPITKHVRLYTQVYSGYGESLIDYNFNQTRVGVGVMLNDLF